MYGSIPVFPPYVYVPISLIVSTSEFVAIKSAPINIALYISDILFFFLGRYRIGIEIYTPTSVNASLQIISKHQYKVGVRWGLDQEPA